MQHLNQQKSVLINEPEVYQHRQNKSIIRGVSPLQSRVYSNQIIQQVPVYSHQILDTQPRILYQPTQQIVYVKEQSQNLMPIQQHNLIPIQQQTLIPTQQQQQSVIPLQQQTVQQNIVHSTLAFETVINKQKTQIESLQQSLNEKENQINELLSENNKLTSLIAMTEDNSSYIQKISTLEKQIHSHQNNHNQQLIQLQTQIGQQNNLINNLQQQIQIYEQEKNKINNSNSSNNLQKAQLILFLGIENERLHEIILQQQQELEKMDTSYQTLIKQSQNNVQQNWQINQKLQYDHQNANFPYQQDQFQIQKQLSSQQQISQQFQFSQQPFQNTNHINRY